VLSKIGRLTFHAGDVLLICLPKENLHPLEKDRVQISGTQSPIWLLSLFFLLADILTQSMSNQTAAAVLVPIAIQTAVLLDYNPRPFTIMIALAASASFITPLEPACMLIYSAGRYRFMDFIRVDGPLTIIIFIIAIILVPLIWAFSIAHPPPARHRSTINPIHPYSRFLTRFPKRVMLRLMSANSQNVMNSQPQWHHFNSMAMGMGTTSHKWLRGDFPLP